MNKIVLKWSKKENDWQFAYPDSDGCRLMGVFFEMLKIEKHRADFLALMNAKSNGKWPLKPNENNPTLKQVLTDAGYDYKTLKITCEKLKNII